MTQTAYEQSLLDGQKLFDQALKEQEEAKRKADFATLHKQAFRAAFDMLKELYPPENTVEYWTFASNRMALKCNELKGNDLAVTLLVALYGWLENLVKGSNKPDEQHSGTIDAGMDGG